VMKNASESAREGGSGMVRWQRVPRHVALVAGLICLACAVTVVPSPVTNLWIAGIEVTQGLQCFDPSHGYAKCPDNSLELDTLKPIAVRVYIGHNGSCAGSDPFATAVKGATVKLNWGAFHQEGIAFLPSETAELTFDVPCSTDLAVLRDDSRGSATFHLMTKKMVNGVWTAVPWQPNKPYVRNYFVASAEIVAPSTLSEQKLDDNTSLVQLGSGLSSSDPKGGLAPHDPFRIRWIPVNYQRGSANYWADWSWMATAFDVADQAFPFPVEYEYAGFWTVYMDKDPVPLSSRYCSVGASISNPTYRHVEKALKLAKKGQAIKYSEPDAWLSWWPREVRGACSLAGMEAGGKVVAMERGSALLTSYTGVHEVGHAASLGHSDDFGCAFEIRETGYDVESQSVVPSTTADVMRSQNPNYGVPFWMSPFDWDRMLGKNASETACVDFTPTMHFPKEELLWFEIPVEMVLVSGIAFDDGTGSLDPLYHLDSAGPYLAPGSVGEFSLAFEDSRGNLIESYGFDLAFTDRESYEELSQDGFVWELPFPREASRLVLRQGGEILAERVRSENPPTVEILEVTPPNGEDGDLSVAWYAFDEDGDDVIAIVFYSADGGMTWIPLAVDISDSEIEFGASHLPGGEEVRVRVVVSDGFRIAETESEAFFVPRKPPELYMVSQGDFLLLSPEDVLSLRAIAIDPEDGQLSGGSVIWRSSRDGLLATGERIYLDGSLVSSGTHRITVHAGDTDGFAVESTADLGGMTEDEASAVVYAEGFAGPGLDSVWQWIREDGENWSLAARPGALRIMTQEGGILEAPNNGRNLLLMPVHSSDFTIETCIEFDPSENFQIAGLLVYQDDDNFLMLGRAYCGDYAGECVGDGLYFDEETNGTQVLPNFATPLEAGSRIHVRLAKRGDEYSAYYSYDRTTWELVGEKSWSSEGPLRVGIAAGDGNQGATSAAADFLYFLLSDE